MPTPTPLKIEPFSPSEVLITWPENQSFRLPYVELRYYCPCAGCVDEHSGQRTVLKTSIPPDIRPLDVALIGRYAVQFLWSDRHDTGMYHFDRLRELCEKQGQRA